MKLDSLQKLYVQELKDLYSAENQLLEALPKMEAAASHAELKKAFRDHLSETKTHVGRLEKIFKKLDFEPGGHKCAAMAGLIEEGSELLKSDIEPKVLDAALIAAAQRVEHYEMAGYGTARAFADQLGDHDSADILQLTLNEEGHANQLLTRLAERSVNFLATTAKGE
ncbi:ferritin-like domain-containing protein [Blastopirellula sp. J2-11]|uniref:YciE/YciF ferroxidase family protein n=1 Tax=Blastopirellula sp. J2-11 TaxID=2943192 RepID=UPI0021C994EA|nr:ferritin-like domain-containing protein [Blastopirellula sp. J2-11]UUO07315.1 ferritin-like domain-containing protein [Blastopirellula sp. J2-11]